MNKADLINALQTELDAHLGLILGSTTKRDAAGTLDAVACVITKGLADGDAYCEAEVTLPGLGKLKTVTRAARTGRNPQTGEPVRIPERVTVKFSAAKALTDLLNA